jgi:hypothetical protein
LNNKKRKQQEKEEKAWFLDNFDNVEKQFDSESEGEQSVGFGIRIWDIEMASCRRSS